MKKIFFLSAMVVFISVTAISVFASSDTWVGNTGNATLNNATNWSPASVPASGDSWMFNTTGTSGSTLTNGLTAGNTTTGITFGSSAPAYNIGGNAIALNGNITNNSSNSQILNMPITSGNITNNGSGTGCVNIGGAISGVTGIVENSATSTLELSGANNYGGSIFVKSGSVIVSSLGYPYLGLGTVTLGDSSTNDSATFQIGGSQSVFANPIILASTTRGALTIASDVIGPFDGYKLTGGVTGNNDLVLNDKGSEAIFFQSGAVNNSGKVINNSSGEGFIFIDSNVGSNVTGLTENSATSGIVARGGITVNPGGTTFIDNVASALSGEGTLWVYNVSGLPVVTGTGNLILQNNGSIDDGIYVDGINNFGEVINSGTGVGSVSIDHIGSNVTGITENSGTSSLSVGNIVVNSSGTTLTDAGGVFTQAGGVTGTGNLVIKNNSSIDNDINFWWSSVGNINNLGTITNSGTGAGSVEIYGIIDSNVTGVIQNSPTSALILSNDNTYTSPTAVNAGTLSVDGSIVSPVTVNRGGTLQGIGTIGNTVLIKSGGILFPGNNSIGSLKITSPLTMDSGSTINVILKNTLAYSQLHLTGNGNSFASGVAVNIELASGATIINGNQFLVVRSDGTITTATPTVIASGSSLTFIPTWGTLDSLYGLILTVGGQEAQTLTSTSTTLPTYSSLAANTNAGSAAAVLDNIKAQGASGDMSTVLNTLDCLSSSGAAAALNTLVPVVDAGIRDNSAAALNNFVGASIERVQGVLTNAAAQISSDTGVSSGDENKLNGIWAKGYGSYLSQGAIKAISGYDAWNAGTAVGFDHMLGDVFTVGVSGGYAYGKANSDENNAVTNIKSAQGTIYAGYQDVSHPYFIDAAGSFAGNWYKGSRDISVGSIDRTADASYRGRQYGVYLDGGYKFDLENNIDFTPLVSIQWSHLGLKSYTETNAGGLDLIVDAQNYNILESGLGAKVSSQIKYKWGNLNPEVYAKWLYDITNDPMAVTSKYTGGGGSFTTNGLKSPKNGANLGGKLAFELKNDTSLIAECDTEMKKHFFGAYGSLTVRRRF